MNTVNPYNRQVGTDIGKKNTGAVNFGALSQCEQKFITCEIDPRIDLDISNSSIL